MISTHSKPFYSESQILCTDNLMKWENTKKTQMPKMPQAFLAPFFSNLFFSRFFSFYFCTKRIHENLKDTKMLETMQVTECVISLCRGIHFTSSLKIRYRKAKLWGIHSMILRDFPAWPWHFLTVFLRDSGNACWVISNTPAEHKPESFANDSTIFGRRIFWSLRTPNVALM